MDKKSFDSFSTLPIRSTASVLNGALKKVKDSMEGKHKRFALRWNRLNNLLMGGLYMGTNVVIAGLSGHGKSYLVNMIQQDMLDQKLNGDLPFKFKIIHFGFEMSGEDEILRAIGGKTGFSYQQLVSAFEPINPGNLTTILDTAKSMNNTDMYFVEKPGNIYEIYATVEKFKNKFPEHEIVITVDHSLLVEYLDEGSEVALMSKFAKVFLQIKKDFGALSITLGQMNNEIERPERRGDPRLHYPIKGDLHGSKQIYHAADIVIVIHRPEMLMLDFYGPMKYPTANLVALHVIKNRSFEPGLIRLEQQLSRGTFIEWAKTAEELPYGL